MKDYPAVARADEITDGRFESGHLWLTEKIDGSLLRVQLRESGLIRVGTAEAVYDDAEAVPEGYRHAVRHVRERLDRGALRAAVDDVESVVLFGEATQKQRLEYDWARVPSFLGFDVWSADGDRGRFLPPDAVERIFERLGLESVPVVERELNTRDFDPESYTIPRSAYYDGPAEGVVARNKAGGRAKIVRPEFETVTAPEPIDASETDVAKRYVDDRRLERIESALLERGEAITVEAMYERTLEDVFREKHRRLFHGGSTLDMAAFRAAVAAEIRAYTDRRAIGSE